MKFTHSLDSLKLRSPVTPDTQIFLTNRQGGYFLSGAQSRYSGFCLFGGKDMFRLLESFDFNQQLVGVDSSFSSATFDYGLFKQQLMLVNNSLVSSLNRPRSFRLYFDIKKTYDNREWGREYSLTPVDDGVVLTFKKKDSDQEELGGGFRFFVAVLGCKFRERQEWVAHEYAQDRKRGSPPYQRYVFSPGLFTGKTLVVSAAKTKAAALKEARELLKKIPSHTLSFLKKPAVKKALEGLSGEEKVACASAFNVLDALTVSKKNMVFAGLPWFFQQWSRDTLISLKGLSMANKSLATKLVTSYLKQITTDGRLPNIKGSKQTNADAVGWLFYRSRELGIAQSQVLPALKKSVSHLPFENGFVINGGGQTWMDTSVKNDDRAGACVEIQAMYAFMLEYTYELTKHKEYKRKLTAFVKLFRQHFWNGHILADRLEDFTIRPNVFLAAYIYPPLLTKKQWETCFENHLKTLWLPWGGLSSIDKHHFLFCLEHTGEDNLSYHRGDSWYWMNNYAALVMARTNHKKFSKYSDQIKQASIRDILWKGVAGCPSELSSAVSQRGEGCSVQLWSAASLVELLGAL